MITFFNAVDLSKHSRYLNGATMNLAVSQALIFVDNICVIRVLGNGGQPKVSQRRP